MLFYEKYITRASIGCLYQYGIQMEQSAGFTRDEFGTTGIRDIEELLDEHGVFLMVTIANCHSELLVILVDLGLWMYNERGATWCASHGQNLPLDDASPLITISQYQG